MFFKSYFKLSSLFFFTIFKQMVNLSHQFQDFYELRSNRGNKSLIETGDYIFETVKKYRWAVFIPAKLAVVNLNMGQVLNKSTD